MSDQPTSTSTASRWWPIVTGVAIVVSVAAVIFLGLYGYLLLTLVLAAGVRHVNRHLRAVLALRWGRWLLITAAVLAAMCCPLLIVAAMGLNVWSMHEMAADDAVNQRQLQRIERIDKQSPEYRQRLERFMDESSARLLESIRHSMRGVYALSLAAAALLVFGACQGAAIYTATRPPRVASQ
ncbi:MAG: hypothetical protein GC159_22765 [Phycisphaera sp.]|nr:hypothetical protein [Phycisphaera sp.]